MRAARVSKFRKLGRGVFPPVSPPLRDLGLLSRMENEAEHVSLPRKDKRSAGSSPARWELYTAEKVGPCSKAADREARNTPTEARRICDCERLTKVRQMR